MDGELLERNVGEWDHSRLQTLIARYLGNREEQWGILVVVEQRVQVKPTRFRVPDISVVKQRPTRGIIKEPPLLCIEIVSPEDRMQQMQNKIDDYLAFGVPSVWLIYPTTRRAFIYTADAVQEVKDGVLSTRELEIRVPLSELE
jgi:Uma2 family endonuclease